MGDNFEFYGASWKNFWWLIRYGDKQIGWEDKKEWPGKPYFFIGFMWYDGPHFVIHLYKFYFGMSPTETK